MEPSLKEDNSQFFLKEQIKVHKINTQVVDASDLGLTEQNGE
jgi:hypothetical protein